MTPEVLARLHAACTEERPWSALEFAALLATPGAFALGDASAVLLGRVAADEAEVMVLATDPARRREGRARALLGAFLAEAAARGARTAFLEVAEDNAPALALYAGAGFARVGRRPGYYGRPDGDVAALVLSRPFP